MYLNTFVYILYIQYRITARKNFFLTLIIITSYLQPLSNTNNSDQVVRPNGRCNFTMDYFDIIIKFMFKINKTSFSTLIIITTTMFSIISCI